MSDTVEIILKIVIALLALFAIGKVVMKKIGRDDKSINIGDNAKINKSFNKKTSVFKRNEKK